MQQTLKDFKKCAAILRGDTDSDDLTITSPLQEMRRLSTLLYHYTGLVKVSCPVCAIFCYKSVMENQLCNIVNVHAHCTTWPHGAKCTLTSEEGRGMEGVGLELWCRVKRKKMSFFYLL